MFTVKSSSEFMAIIRSLDEKLKNVKLSNVEIDRNRYSITYNFVCDNYIDKELQGKIQEQADKISDKSFLHVNVVIKKLSNDGELIRSEIFKFLQSNYPSISIFLSLNDVIVSVEGNLAKYTLMLTKEGIDYVNKNKIINVINEKMSKSFCAEFSGRTDQKENVEKIDLLSDEVFESEIQRVEHRTIKVKDVVAIDDFSCEDTAIYIEDALSGNVTVCGIITEIAEKRTKTDKPFYIFHIDDTTAKTSGVYFTRKNTIRKIQDLKVGDAIIARVKIEDYNGKRSTVFDKINRCTFPEDFKKKEKFKKSAPKEYKLIFPEEATTLKVSTVFDKELAMPKELTEKTYVVFDLETTGTDTLKDGITEIGAVKIVGGKIAEQFQTLVNPDKVITEEITKLTGISNEMVKEAPRISAVLPDFVKFMEGAVLVAQNADFDTGFMRRFCNIEEYKFEHEVLDTMKLFQKYVPEERYANLDVIAKHFNIVFHHHRALADAYAEAEAFIELMKIKAKKEGTN